MVPRKVISMLSIRWIPSFMLIISLCLFGHWVFCNATIYPTGHGEQGKSVRREVSASAGRNPVVLSATGTRQPQQQVNKPTESTCKLPDGDMSPCWIGKDMLSPNGKYYQTLKAKASVDNVIILASVDAAFVEMAYNYYESSIKRFNITNFLFICSDIKAVQLLQENGIECFLYHQDTKNDAETEWNTKDFILKMRVKMKMVTAAVMLGFTTVLSDIDLFFMKDPTPKFNISGDISFMSDVYKDNCGFYIARPTNSTIELHKRTLKSVMTHVIADQVAMAVAIGQMRSKHLLKKSSLSREEFACGLLYFEKGKRMFLTDRPCRGRSCNTYVIHNNWIVGLAAKIYRFKEMGMWVYDPNGYYSNPSRKYLEYSNPTDFGGKSRDKEREALISALRVARLLNRTLILPKFHCLGCHSQVCKIASDHCAFNTHFNIHDFDHFFKNQYREHVFLMNPKVPEAVKKSESPEICILTKDIANTNHLSNCSISFNATDYNNGSVATEDLIKWLGEGSLIKFSVLRFHSLYLNITPVDTAWEDMLERSLQWSNYRQLGHQRI